MEGHARLILVYFWLVLFLVSLLLGGYYRRGLPLVFILTLALRQIGK
jgi:hypothetical protein